MEHNCAGRHVPERAFNCIENADALIHIQKHIEVINITVGKSSTLRRGLVMYTAILWNLIFNIKMQQLSSTSMIYIKVTKFFSV